MCKFIVHIIIYYNMRYHTSHIPLIELYKVFQPHASFIQGYVLQQNICAVVVAFSTFVLFKNLYYKKCSSVCFENIPE